MSVACSFFQYLGLMLSHRDIKNDVFRQMEVISGVFLSSGSGMEDSDDKCWAPGPEWTIYDNLNWVIGQFCLIIIFPVLFFLFKVLAELSPRSKRYMLYRRPTTLQEGKSENIKHCHCCGLRKRHTRSKDQDDPDGNVLPIKTVACGCMREYQPHCDERDPKEVRVLARVAHLSRIHAGCSTLRTRFGSVGYKRP